MLNMPDSCSQSIGVRGGRGEGGEEEEGGREVGLLLSPELEVRPV